MLRSFQLTVLLSLFVFAGSAADITVKNIDELNKANAAARPGDVITLQDGEWKNVTIELTCKGTAAQPVIFRAATAGKVILTGISRLLIGGEYITVDGLHFKNGHSGKSAVIQFRDSKKNVANYSRVTNTVIDGFNNPLRLDENNWVLFYGKHNRMDHCTLRDKQNMGVTVAVVLDDERSRENYHSIDHNHFGLRIPLGSNGGETIRVGVSQHCEFNSNTSIVNNFFEHTDGETEIVSIKSGANVISNNLFKECFGSLVLRHGDNNVVENNIFLGNGKEGSGGVRVINKGQWVVNNFFYRLTGSEFRSPLAVMNGVPNSPANRYVAAENAVIANNTWFECTPLGFCIGSDAERSQRPENIHFLNNLVYSRAQTIYDVYDKMDGFHFAGNYTGNNVSQELPVGFRKTLLTTMQAQQISLPAAAEAGSKIADSIQSISATRKRRSISSTAGFSGAAVLSSVLKNATDSCGARWFEPVEKTFNKLTYTCKDAGQLIASLAESRADYTVIRLTGSAYEFDLPVVINGNVTITSAKKIRFASNKKLPYLFEVKGGGILTLSGLSIDMAGLQSERFLITDKDAATRHMNVILQKNSFTGFNGFFFEASKTSQLDSMVIAQNKFINNRGTLFYFMNETDKKGYYNVERLFFNNNKITGQRGQVISMLRGGNDESTMGPRVWFNKNILTNCSAGGKPLIHYYGTQYSSEENNRFLNCNPGGILIKYEDAVKAVHLFKNNKVQNSGEVASNTYTEMEKNKIAD